MAQKGLNISQLAIESKVTYPTAHRIAKGKAEAISFNVLERVCKVLGLTPNDLLKGE